MHNLETTDDYWQDQPGNAMPVAQSTWRRMPCHPSAQSPSPWRRRYSANHCPAGHLSRLQKAYYTIGKDPIALSLQLLFLTCPRQAVNEDAACGYIFPPGRPTHIWLGRICTTSLLLLHRRITPAPCGVSRHAGHLHWAR